MDMKRRRVGGTTKLKLQIAALPISNIQYV